MAGVDRNFRMSSEAKRFAAMNVPKGERRSWFKSQAAAEAYSNDTRQKGERFVMMYTIDKYGRRVKSKTND